MNHHPNRGSPGDDIEVEATGRLHLGFFDLNGGIGRRFGSFGLALDGPYTRLTVGRCASTRIDGPESERAARYLAALQTALGAATAHRVRIEAAIPSHAGLGSGTQLALALAAALRRLHGLPLDVAGAARQLGRGNRSGIGIGLFQSGGIIVDGGRGPNTGGVPPVLVRAAFPDDWRIVLILDPGCGGVHGKAEIAAFDELPPMDRAVAADISHRVLMQALPALAERDIVPFGAAVRAIQRHLGTHFAPRQGGHRFTSAKVAAALEFLDAAGAHGTGQSSWGPTGFAFCADAVEAQRHAAALRHRFTGTGLDIRVVRGLNRGALVRALAPAGQWQTL